MFLGALPQDAVELCPETTPSLVRGKDSLVDEQPEPSPRKSTCWLFGPFLLIVFHFLCGKVCAFYLSGEGRRCKRWELSSLVLVVLTPFYYLEDH